MAWQYDVQFEDVKVDIEYTADRDIETGEWFNTIESIEINGTDVAPLIYFGADTRKTEDALNAALEAAIKADQNDAVQTRRVKLLDRAMGNPLGMLAGLKLAA